MRYDEIEELAVNIVCGGDDTKIEEFYNNGDDIDTALMERYDDQVDMSVFEKLLTDLIQYTPVIQSPITKDLFHCFGKTHGSMFEAIIKFKHK